MKNFKYIVDHLIRGYFLFGDKILQKFYFFIQYPRLFTKTTNFSYYMLSPSLMIAQKSILSVLSLATLASCTPSGGNQTVETTPTPTQPTPRVATVTNTLAISKNVTKAQEVNYTSPAGPESMKASITTNDGIITEASITPLATNPISLKLQGAFAKDISGKVVGKAIKDLQVDTVSGASLTSAAFNEFLKSMN